MPRRAPLALALLLGAWPAHADYKDSYRKGIEALDRKRWDEVVRHMQQAIGQNPTEGERIKLYGLRFEPYFPHFYLGAAYLNQGHCEKAVKAFEASRSQGAIRSTPKYSELVDGLKSCEGAVPTKPVASQPSPPAPTQPTTPAKPAGPDPALLAGAVQSADSAVTQAEAAARSVAALGADAALAPVWSREPGLGRAESEARDALAQARARLDAGRRASDLAMLGESRDLAVRARQRLEEVQRLAQQRRDALRRPTPGVTPGTQPSAPPRLTAPAAELLSAAQAFFGAKYEEAIRLSERATGLQGRSAAQSHLLRAASRHALYRIGAEKDTALRAQALEDVLACRRADPNLSPDPAYFSPQFAEFFRGGR